MKRHFYQFTSPHRHMSLEVKEYKSKVDVTFLASPTDGVPKSEIDQSIRWAAYVTKTAIPDDGRTVNFRNGILLPK